jgi:hypothetical protein
VDVQARGIYFDVSPDLDVQMTLYAPVAIPGEQVSTATMMRRVLGLPQGYGADLALICDVYHFTVDDLADLLRFTDTIYVIGRYFQGEAGAHVYEDGIGGGAWWRTEEGIVYRPDQTSPAYPPTPDLNWLFESKCHVGMALGQRVMMNSVFERSFGNLSVIRVQRTVTPTVMTLVQQAPPPGACVQLMRVNPPYFTGNFFSRKWQAIELGILEFWDETLRDPLLQVWTPALGLAHNLATRPLHGQTSDSAIRAVEHFLANDAVWQRLNLLRGDPVWMRVVLSDTASALRNSCRREIVGKLHADKRRDALMCGQIEELRNPKALSVSKMMLSWTLRLSAATAVVGVLWYVRPVAQNWTLINPKGLRSLVESLFGSPDRQRELVNRVTMMLPAAKPIHVATATGAAVGAAFGAGGHTWPVPPTWGPSKQC